MEDWNHKTKQNKKTPNCFKFGTTREISQKNNKAKNIHERLHTMYKYEMGHLRGKVLKVKIYSSHYIWKRDYLNF